MRRASGAMAQPVHRDDDEGDVMAWLDRITLRRSPRERYGPSLPPVTPADAWAHLEGLERVRVRLLGPRRACSVATEQPTASPARLDVVLASVEGEREPRWIAAKRIEGLGYRAEAEEIG